MFFIKFGGFQPLFLQIFLLSLSLFFSWNFWCTYVGIVDIVPKIPLWQNFLAHWAGQRVGRSPRPKCHRFPMFLLEIQQFLSINDSWIVVYPWSISRVMKWLFLSILCFARRGFASLLIRPQSRVPPLNIAKLTFQKNLLTYTPRALIFLIKWFLLEVELEFY